MDKKFTLKNNIPFWLIIVAIIAFIIGALFKGKLVYERITSDFVQSDTPCNVLGIRINGYLSTYGVPTSGDSTSTTGGGGAFSDDIVSKIESANNDWGTKGIMLSIDSSGGDGVAGEEVANALKAFTKPSIAVIRSMGASAAYWAATGANHIYASKISNVGSIGFTASYLDQAGKDEKDGYHFNSLASGPYKDIWNPDKTLSYDERSVIMSDLNKVYKVFVEEVASNRNMPIDDIKKLATGRTYVGDDAFQNGLIDAIGGVPEATFWMNQQIGEDVRVCWE